MSTSRFEQQDLADELPSPGVYASTVRTARVCRSHGGSRLVQVVYALLGILSGLDRVSEYFVLEGASPRGLALARRRLVELYRACGLDPRPGDEIDPGGLVGSRLEIRIQHEPWQGQMKMRVLAHRRLASSACRRDDDASDGVPF